MTGTLRGYNVISEWLAACRGRSECTFRLHPQFPGPIRNEQNDKNVRALQAWPDDASQSPGDGALDPQPGGGGPGAEPAGNRILRAARLRGTFDHRGKPDLAAGPGLSGHPRHFFEATGR